MMFKVGDYFTYTGVSGTKRYGLVQGVGKSHEVYTVVTANTLENVEKYKDYTRNWRNLWPKYGRGLTMQPLDNFSVNEEDLWE